MPFVEERTSLQDIIFIYMYTSSIYVLAKIKTKVFIKVVAGRR